MRRVFVSLICFLILAHCIGAGEVPDRPLEQSERLATLGKVWGLLKYFHPNVATGAIDWDASLLEAIPRVKGAVDFVSFNQELDNLILEAGDVTKVEANPHTAAYPNEALFKWLKRDPILDEVVREKLQLIQKKYEPKANVYVGYKPVGVISTESESRFLLPEYPDEGHRLLALFRYWNIINYYFPYKDLIDEDWDKVLVEFTERLSTAANGYEFACAFKELTTRIDDGHAYMSSVYFDWYIGNWYAPVEASYIEGKTVISKIFPTLMQPSGGLRVGDVILKCRNVDVEAFRAFMRKYAQGSNETWRQYVINEYVIRSREQTIPFTIERDGQILDLEVQGVLYPELSQAMTEEKQTLPAWEILPGNIAYVNMEILKYEDVHSVMPQLMGTRAIVFDLRGYPNGTMYRLSIYLISNPKRFVKLQLPEKNYPGVFYWDKYRYAGLQKQDYYKGKVIILVNEETVSQSEFTCMVLEVAPDVTIIGSQTAGADGNVVLVNVPGGIYTAFSGMGIYYPNGKPTQQVGIAPDIYCRPTIAGIRQGRDEVLERALEFVESSE